MQNKTIENAKLKVDNSPSSSLSLSKCEGVGCETARGSANCTESPKKVPKLRFKEFTSTSLSTGSGEWVEKKLGDLGEFQGGGTPKTSEHKYWNGDIPWVSSSDIIEDNIRNFHISRFINNNAIKESATKLIKEGSILFVSRVGVGKLAVAHSDLCTSQDFTNLHLKNDNSYYMAYYFLSRKNILERYSQGTSIKGFTGNDLKNLKINLPTLPEQQKIADCLSTWDESIENLKLLIENKKLYKKGMMQKLFNGKLKVENGKCVFEEPSLRFSPSQAEIDQAIENGKLKNENGQWIASEESPIIFNSQLSTFNYTDWVEKKLGEVAKISTGNSNREDSSLDGEYTFFDRSEDIRTSSIYLFDGEAVIVAGEGQRFIPKYFIGKFDLHQRTYAIMDFKDACGKFIFYKIYTKQNYFLAQAVGSTVKSLRLPMFIKVPLKLPCLQEQTKIANFLSAIDEEIELLEQELEQLQLQKKGLMQGMFV